MSRKTPRLKEAPSSQGPARRLHKLLAEAGLGSRRRMESLITEGRITVDGRPARLGERISGTERIVIDGRPVQLDSREPAARVILYNKPTGELVSRDDPQGRATVFDRLPPVRGGRWIAIGRLDYNTSGLLLFTTSGDLAHKLMHPSSEIEREYAVRVRGELSEQHMRGLVQGVRLEDGPARLERIERRGGRGANRWYHVVLKEGRNREVRRMFEALGYTVSRLIRVRFGALALPPRLRPGRCQELRPREVGMLLSGKRRSDAIAGPPTKVSMRTF